MTFDFCISLVVKAGWGNKASIKYLAPLRKSCPSLTPRSAASLTTAKLSAISFAAKYPSSDDQSSTD